MCGIFGIVSGKNSSFEPNDFKKLTGELFKLSESRGKEASGLAVLSGEKIQIYKDSVTASVLLRKESYHHLFKEINHNSPLAYLGHARLATNGVLAKNINNQPVIKNNIVGIHNGIIVNDEAIWKKFPSLKREYEVDTEAILALTRMFLEKKQTLPEAVSNTFKEIEGAASIALLFSDFPYLLLATNTGSLYYLKNKKQKYVIFASERYILEKISPQGEIQQLAPGNIGLVNINNLTIGLCTIDKPKKTAIQTNQIKKEIIDLSSYQKISSIPEIPLTIPKDIANNVKQNLQKINSLKRCSKCLLPETMPFIEFDHDGVCNYCKNHQKMKIKNITELKKSLNLKKNGSIKNDCLMTFSGGRDSSFGLHYFKKILKMNPVAYSYDWGMITDLGRRNQARMTGKLGVEHILVSANIKKKRESIRKNVQAWLRRPVLGTIPLFMAGDKQYFYYANKLGKRLKIPAIILCVNPLEKTDFKFGFCGVRPNANVQYRLTLSNKIKMAFYYLKEYILNPYYINSSLLDTILAFFSYYFIPHDYVSFFEFKRWNEKEINQTLLKQYNWEIAKDTKTTWRIGDGTAAFYNYIYLIMAGFTENDTFRSNQIREGDISRQEGLSLLREDNKIRYESIKWYCETIGIDFLTTLKTINNASKRYH